MPEDHEARPDAGLPSVTFATITFSDGTPVHLDPADVVVLVGPNNAGKSAALRELDRAFDRQRSLTVLQDYNMRTAGTPDDFEQFVTKHARVKSEGGSFSYSGYRWSRSVQTRSELRDLWPDQFYRFKPLFCLNMPTENRITGSDPAGAVNPSEDLLEHPIHMLIDDDELEVSLSEHFRRAFHADIVVDPIGRTIPLFVGSRPDPDSRGGEDRRSKTYRDRVRDVTIPLTEQGDGMRSFASVILHLLAPVTASVLLLDEPEAFLHPPQARLLGELIATKKPSRSQLFVATHSPDVLQGLVNVASDRLRLIRIQRDGDVNRVKELDKDLVKKIGNDPLMNYSSVMSGVFHERVIVCESDGDCMFYSSILDLDEVHGEGHPDVLFVHGSGKDRMATLAETLTALHVPVDVVADIDIVRDEEGMRKVITALDGDWTAIQPIARSVRTAIDNDKPMLSLDQIKQAIRKALDSESSSSDPVGSLRSAILAVFRSASPWDGVKQAGVSAIPQGQATQQFQQLRKLCEEAGLWIVPVGEMEGFCRTIGGHGPRWVQQVIDARQLATDPDLESAREFVRTLWNSKR